MSNSLSGKMPFQHKVRYYLLICKGTLWLGLGFLMAFVGLFLLGVIYVWHFESQANREDILELRRDNRQTHEWALGSEARYWEAREDVKQLKGKKREKNE